MTKPQKKSKSARAKRKPKRQPSLPQQITEFASKLIKSPNLTRYKPEELQLGQELIQRTLLEYATEGKSTTMDQLYELDFVRKPPTVEEFLTSPEYLGDVCTPDMQNHKYGLFNKWKEAMTMDMQVDSVVQQVILTGAIGMGKTWFGVVLALYKLAFCLCLRQPVEYYGLSAASSITFTFLSVTQKQVKGGIFSDCIKFLHSSPFFVERIITNSQTRKFADRRIEFQGGIVVEAGSQLSEALGRNVLVAVIDEINFRLEADAAAAAHELVEAVHRRTMSRFRTGDSHPGLMILISSAQNDTDFLVNYIKQHRHDPTVRVYDYPWWEVAGPYHHAYSGEMFMIDIGDTLIPPRFLDGTEDLSEVPPDRIMQVPVEHRPEFERDLMGAIRDVAGRATGRTSKLFPNILPLINCIGDDLVNPFKQDSVPLSIGVSQRSIQEYLDVEKMLKWADSRPQPKRHPAAPRFIHLDMSTGAQDAMSIVMLHPVSLVEVEGYDPQTHRAAQQFKPLYELDFAVRIIRDPTKRDVPIDFNRVRDFIGWLRVRHFRIAMVSCDMRELSAEMRAILQFNNFETEYLSVDKKKDQYYQLKQTILEGRLYLPDHDYLMFELQNLEDLEDKIDHPETVPVTRMHGQNLFNVPGSKDLADGLAGAMWMASQSEAGGIAASDPRARADALNAMTQVGNLGAESWLAGGAPKDKARIF